MTEAVAVVGAISSALQLVECVTNIISHTRALVSDGANGVQEHERLKSLASQYQSLGETSSALAKTPGSADDGSSEVKQDTSIWMSSQVNVLAYSYGHLPGLCGSLSKHRPAIAHNENVLRLGRQCEVESRKLVEMLGAWNVDPNARGWRRLAKALNIAVKSLRDRRDIEKCLEDLRELNSQLCTAILLSIYAKEEDTRWQTPFTKLLPTEDMRGVFDDDVDNVSLLVKRQRQELHEKRRNAIRRSLKFVTSEDRWNAITRAYPRTYEWAVHESSSMIRQWLQNDNGLFWVSGKAGSGKSTLMKFLCEAEETKNILSVWNRDQSVITASFFFWYAGTHLQKSTTGLLRTICHQILAAEPTLTEVGFSGRFEGYHFSDPSEYEPSEWEHDELVEGLREIALHRNDGTLHKKYCFFIDGLDEFKGDHLELIALLQNLATHENFKLCISSRPWNAFRNAFGSETPQLRLEDLSKPDLEQYTRGSIRTAIDRSPLTNLSDDAEQAEVLITGIVEKAEGVFLWVVLVVKSLIRGFAEGDPIFMLRHRLLHFPADLEEFFRCMLDRVEEVYKSHAHQALKLAFLFAQEGSKMQELSTFIDYWLIGQSPNGIEEPEFAYEQQLRTVTPDEISNMIKRTQNMLCSACKDLLNVVQTDSFDSLFTRVEFLHRTVYDFLRNEEIQRLLDENIPNHFKSPRIFYLLNLARLKFHASGLSIPRYHRPPKKEQRPFAHYEDHSLGTKFEIDGFGNQQYSCNEDLVEDCDWTLSERRNISVSSSCSHEESVKVSFNASGASFTQLATLDSDSDEGSSWHSAFSTPQGSPSRTTDTRSQNRPLDRPDLLMNIPGTSSATSLPRQIARNIHFTEPVFDYSVEDFKMQKFSSFAKVPLDALMIGNPDSQRFADILAGDASGRCGEPSAKSIAFANHSGRIPHASGSNNKLPSLLGNSGDSRSRLSEDVHQVSKLSVEKIHQDLNEGYLDSFAAAATQRLGRIGLLNHFMKNPRQLCHYLATPKSMVGLECLIELSPDVYERTFSHGEKTSFFLAALGEDPFHAFEIHQARLRLIQELCRLGPIQDWLVYSDSCYFNAWELFLRKWALLSTQRSYTQTPEQKRLGLVRRLWEVAKTFLNTTHLGFRGIFCVAPKSGKTLTHTHQMCHMRDFFKSNVPETWLREVLWLDYWVEEGCRMGAWNGKAAEQR